MLNSKRHRAALVIGTNLLLGWVLLSFHNLQSLWPPFAFAAIGLMSLSLLALSGRRILMKALTLSFSISILIPMVGLWLVKMDQSTVEGFFIVGLFGVGLGWKECLLMFCVNSALFTWYSGATQGKPPDSKRVRAHR
ncbi:MAG: hypothetical protein AB7G93_20040 [Bdellovibrionales bacterium]